MSIPIIQPQWHFAIWAVLISLAALGLWLEGTVVGRKFSGVLSAMVIAIVLSNIGIIPKSAPAYDVVWQYLVPLAIPLFLLKADLASIIADTGTMLGAFVIAVVGTLCGVLAAYILVPLGEHSSEVVGLLTASYIGGGVNFAAMASVLEIQDAGLLSATTAADNVVGAAYIALLAYMPSIIVLRHWLPSKIIDAPSACKQIPNEQNTIHGAFDMANIALSLAISFGICGLGYGLAELLGMANYGILFITALSLIIANVFSKRLQYLSGEFEMGLIMMYVFLVTIGAQADFVAVIQSGMHIFWFTVVIVAVHLTVVLLGAKLFKIDLAEVIIASNACAAGPTTAVALAAARNWHRLVTPGLMCGILGYAIANFIASALAVYLPRFLHLGGG